MKSVSWQSKSNIVYQSILNGSIDANANGGNAYDIQAALFLKEKFDLYASYQCVRLRNENLLKYIYRLKNNKETADIQIREPYPIVFGKYQKQQKFIGIIHHIDTSDTTKNIYHSYYFHQLKKNLLKCDVVVTVSSFWNKYVREIGCMNVVTIYNSFNTSIYNYQQIDKNIFKNKHGLTENKKLIYIGNASREKGVYKVYEALKDSGFELIMSGASNKAPDLPVRYFNLNGDDYRKMLFSCDAVVCMSEMPEGWNRIAHEAMLCGTPVIGNGSGGMAELLANGSQVCIQNPGELYETINAVLQNRSHYAQKGKEYVQKFDLVYFKNEWQQLVQSLL